MPKLSAAWQQMLTHLAGMLSAQSRSSRKAAIIDSLHNNQELTQQTRQECTQQAPEQGNLVTCIDMLLQAHRVRMRDWRLLRNRLKQRVLC